MAIDFKLTAGGMAEEWQRFEQTAREQAVDLTAFDARRDELLFVWHASEFVRQYAERHPTRFLALWQSGDLWRCYAAGELVASIADVVARCEDDNALKLALRTRRQREMVRIAWRDIAGYAGLIEVTADLSALAEGCVDAALARIYAWQCREIGIPSNAAGVAQQLVVLGMGKLGAHELNFSSDIDLIFCYPDEGETRDGPRCLSNEEFFRRLGQRLIQAIDQVTADGQVFRVDMRLRPYGDSGPLAVSFDGMEDYYQTQGREWERYAMIKARVIAGDREAGKALMDILRPFVFRRYLDYGAFESLREMKEMIAAEVRRKGMADNVKLGPGGIREIEFIGQAFQLIRGGREPELQQRRIQDILPALVRHNCLPDYVVQELLQAYEFLRNVEHRLQQYRDAQTHKLPGNDADWQRLAISMGYATVEAFQQVLMRHRAKVQAHFDQVFAAPQAGDSEAVRQGAGSVWQELIGDEQASEVLHGLGYQDAAAALEILAQLRASHAVRALSDQGRRRLNQLMPLLIGVAAKGQQAEITLQRLVELVGRIVRRSAYLALLLEHPMALSQLASLCGASAWISQLLVKYPVLLDELLDPRQLYRPPEKPALVQELAVRLSKYADDDYEHRLDALRHFKQINVLRVAAADIAGAVPLMVVSDHLSWIAETLLEQVLAMSWQEQVGKYGQPGLLSVDYQTGFIIVAYGKLGGLELGYGSDLDIVFVHAAAEGETDGARAVDNAVFQARLGQRIIHTLTAPTAAGVVYEVDTRLRPSGASGLLVTSLAAFDQYQRDEAWTWEHQALVRARVVAGDPVLAQQFEQVRAAVLRRARERDALRNEVRDMRLRMREQLAKAKPGQFDLKQGVGGIADIEFIVQYGVLGWAAEHPGLCEYTDNIRLLERLAEYGVLKSEEAALLADAYRAYRSRLHRLALQNAPGIVAEDELAEFRSGVERIWTAVMEDVEHA